MSIRWIQIIRGLLIFIVVSASTTAASAKEKLTVEELVARHLKAVGAPEKIAARKSCIAEGRGSLRSLLANKGTLTGAAFMISEGEKLRFNIRIGAPNYPAEQFAYDGNKVDTGVLTPGVRSQLGQFLYLHSFILKEGLPGSVISTAWPLFDLAKRAPRLRYGGLKKIDGKELHELKYMAKKGESELDIYLYFDPETYRHVQTTYNLIQPAPLQGSENRLQIKEKFDNFIEVEGLTLPSHWNLVFIAQAQQTSTMLEWDMKYEKITFNVPIEKEIFTVP